MPGTVVRVEARPGAAVSAGQVLVVLEAMKMEHRCRAPHDGTVAEYACRPGRPVDQGTVLAVVDSGDSEGEADGADGPVTRNERQRCATRSLTASRG